MLKKFITPGGSLLHEIPVQKVFTGNDMCHCQKQCHIGTDTDWQVQGGYFCQPCLARVGDDHFGAPFERLFNAGRRHGVALGHIGPDAEDDIGLIHVGQGVRHRPASDGGCQTGNRRSVSGTAAVVNLVGAESRPDQLLHGVIRL